MKGLHLIDIHRLNSGEKLVLPALCLNVLNAQELQTLLHHCTPTQPLMLFHQETYLFEGQKSELSHFDWAYPLHVYLADPVRESYRRLVDIVAQLRHPETGCPWDLAQTSLSLTPYIVEEAYEVVHAIGTGDVTAIQEELGDLLLQVVLQAQIAQEQGNFSLVEVANGISEKLIRRHPHVFGALAVDDVAVIRRNWEAIKQQDQGHSITEKLHHYMATFPALIAAGYDADLVLVDLTHTQPVRREDLQTKCGWSPFEGWELTGWPQVTIVGGQIVYYRGQFNEQVRGQALQFSEH